MTFTKEQLKEFDDTRKGKNICENCNQPKEMYYSPYCPRCEKPEVENNILNYIKCLRYLEVTVEDGIKARLNESLFEHYNFSNDTLFKLYFPEEDEYEEFDYNESAKQYLKDILLIKETWNLGDMVIMDVSW